MDPFEQTSKRSLFVARAVYTNKNRHLNLTQTFNMLYKAQKLLMYRHKAQTFKKAIANDEKTSDRIQSNILVHIELVMRLSVRTHIHLFVLGDAPLKEVGFAVD